MRILFALHKIQDLGGIINHTEHLAWGFQQLGAQTDIIQLQYGTSPPTRRTFKRENGSFRSIFGIPADQFAGWAFPPEMRLSYVDNKKWKQIVKDYDLVIWEVPLPSKPVRGERAPWEFLTQIKTPQIFVVHDGNFIRNNSELTKMDNHPFVAVHPCASGTLTEAEVPHKLIVNPQRMERRLHTFDWHQRSKVVGSLQTFKAWKRVNEYLTTIPKLEEPSMIWLAGGGIMHRYLTSKTKVKKGYEPKIWHAARDAGMEFFGYLSEEQRDEKLRFTRLLCDFSYSKNYVQYGAHFNRVLVDALMQGCIPVAYVDMTDSKGYFQSMKNYFPLSDEPWNDIDNALCMSRNRAKEFWENGQKLLKKFDAKRVAMKYLEVV